MTFENASMEEVKEAVTKFVDSHSQWKMGKPSEQRENMMVLFFFTEKCEWMDKVEITLDKHEQGTVVSVKSKSTNLFCMSSAICYVPRFLCCWICCFEDHGQNAIHIRELSASIAETLKHNLEITYPKKERTK